MTSERDRAPDAAPRRPSLAARPWALRRRRKPHGTAVDEGAPLPLRPRPDRGRSNGRGARPPRVEKVLTGEDLAWAEPIPVRTRTEHQLDDFLQPVLARDRVRYVGEPIAAVLAEDAYLAED